MTYEQYLTSVNKRQMTYTEFDSLFRTIRDDRSLKHSESWDLRKLMEKKHSKFYGKFHLLDGFGRLAPGDLILFVNKKTSRTGISRLFKVYKIVQEKDGNQTLANLTYHVARALGYSVPHNFEGFRTDSSAESITFELSLALFGYDTEKLRNEEL